MGTFDDPGRPPSASRADLRQRLLDDLPVTERHHRLAGIDTAIVEGGEGRPIILLHGPGESAVWWRRVFPLLAPDHRVIAPDLPGHGASDAVGGWDAERHYEWLDALIDATVGAQPVLVGHIVGGGLAARYAARRRRRLDRLILVDTLGLRRLRPAPSFAFGLMRFMASPTPKNHDRFMRQCMLDPEGLEAQMGAAWEVFRSYNLAMANDPARKRGMQEAMRLFGFGRIPPDELARIEVETHLIWGRGDKATPLAVAERASARYGWPLHVIDGARDDPKLERPAAFADAVLQSMGPRLERPLTHRD